MGTRMTRKKAAEVAEQLHIDEDELLARPYDDPSAIAKVATPEPADRAPLGDIAPNSAESKSQSDDGAQELKKSTRRKKPRKLGPGRGKKNNPAASTTSVADVADEDGSKEVIPDEDDSAPSPASEKAAEDLLKDVPERVHKVSIEDTTRPRSPPSAAVKLTRSQLKEQAEIATEPKTLVDGIGQTPEEQVETMGEDTTRDIPVFDASGVIDFDETPGPMTQTSMDAPISPPPNAIPTVISRLRTDTPGKRSTSNKENVEPVSMASPQTRNYDALEDAVTTATPPPPSHTRRPSPRPEDNIVALDELDDAVENANKDIPEVQTSPEKPKTRESNGTPKKDSKKTAPVVRTTKSSAARLSMAQNAKDPSNNRAPALGRPRESTALGRASSVRDTASTSKRITSTSSNRGEKPAMDGEKKDVVIPHSKPRPVSLSFPTPPPPPKSKKAPTQSTFQLPGEAVAAKLKAAREARMQKGAEDLEKKNMNTSQSKQRPTSLSFPAPPPPAKSKKALTQSTFQLSGDAVAARLKAAREARTQKETDKEEEKKKTPFKARPVPASLSKAPSVRQTSASKARESLMNGKDLRASTSAAPGGGLQRANSIATARSRPPVAKPTQDSLAVKKRPSTASASLSKPRESMMSVSTGTARVPSKGTAKGKEVFNRAANAKATADSEKHSREEAAKKARADAGERSKQLAREFAEKQRRKKMGGKAKEVQQTEGGLEAEPAAVKAPIDAVDAAPAVTV
ncbi:hypothetical protein LTR37_002332 [Vermiconidia calcicola]|uniref:Uncharacterized protein n=1 Tax=Vermiconidia calcicola TaxID=1690605 RepID=A0ACC3NTD2_9PEZI|nr:hypothetical protein LTR37_002332 [Vermiconidia calcicola]